jgi:hypothetical protein
MRTAVLYLHVSTHSVGILAGCGPGVELDRQLSLASEPTRLPPYATATDLSLFAPMAACAGGLVSWGRTTDAVYQPSQTSQSDGYPASEWHFYL